MSLEGKTILVTGAAGFIGSALVNKLLDSNAKIVGIDNINNYYSQDLKRARVLEIRKKVVELQGTFNLYESSIEISKNIESISSKYKFDIVVHLAAQAGVRYSLDNPDSYINSNLVGFGNILELCKNQCTKNFIYASSSSVYGGNKKLPFEESDKVELPLNLYAATKRSNELMAYSYSHLYQIPTTGLRFFTVYGPWGRPDMAPMIFTDAILKSSKIKVFNNGKMRRDFTYIDDIVEGIYRCCKKPATPEKISTNKIMSAPYRIFNIGNGNPINLMDFIRYLENTIGIKVTKEFCSIQAGDAVETWACTSKLKDWIDYSPKTSVQEGIELLVNWYRNFYSL